MLAFGATFAAAQVSSIVVGAIVPVLAWRLAADVAEERGLPTGRARTLSIGTGLVTAVYLPLLLHSALPDSTMPFTALVLAACLLMSRIARDPRGARWSDPRLIGLGLLIGLTALTRNEALWLGAAWALVAWRAGDPRPSRAERVRLIAVAGVVAFLVFVPWMLRDWLEFGSPLPGQAVANAFSVTGFDIFAWNDPPTLSRYLAVGPARLLEMRVEGFMHNLFNVLVLPGLPISLIGLAALPWQWRGAALRPLVVVGAMTFLVTTLFFPVATTWGTFLHAAGPIQVLIVLSALLALDAGIARLGARLGWTRPVAWLGPLLGVFGSILFSVTILPTFAAGTRGSAELYDELARRMALAGEPLDASSGPVIANFPIWMAWAERVDALALPDETPADVLDLAAAFPGTRLLVIVGRGPRRLAGHPRLGRAGDRVLHAGRPRVAAADRHGGPAGGRARVRDGLPMNDDPYTRTSMDAARARTEARDTDLAVSSVGADVQTRIVQAQEAERLRLAQEIHDGPAQALSNAIFQVEYIERVIETDVTLARTELGYLREALRRELGDVRSFMSQLRPPVLNELGLVGAIQDTIDLIRSFTGATITADLSAPDDPLSDTERTVVLRVAQEALQNIRKHAQARTVSVSTFEDDGEWVLEVGDDGRGFDPGDTAARGRRSFGIQFMRERASLIGARLDVRSRPGGGTVVRLAIPTRAQTGT